MLTKNSVQKKVFPISLLFFIDALLTAFSFIASYALCSYILDDISAHSMLIQLPIVVSLTSLIFLFIGIYKGIVKTNGLKEVYSIFNAICLANILTIVLVVVNGKLILEEDLMVPLSIIIVHSIFSFSALVISRILYKYIIRRIVKLNVNANKILLVHDLANNDSRLSSLQNKLLENGREVVQMVTLKSESYAEDLSKFKTENSVFDEVLIVKSNKVITKIASFFQPILDLNLPIYTFSLPNSNEEINLNESPNKKNGLKRLELSDLFTSNIESQFQFGTNNALFLGETILVTGAGGCVGSQFVKELFYSNIKATLILVDRSETALLEIVNFMKNSNRLTIVPKLLDLKDKKSIEKIFKNHQISLVVHAAGNNFPESLNEDIGKVMHENLTITKSLADCSNKSNVKKFIFCSSVGAENPRTTLEVSKRLAEIYLLSFQKIENATNFISLRLNRIHDSKGSGIGYLRNQLLFDKPINRFLFSENEVYSNKKDVARSLLLLANQNCVFSQAVLTHNLGFEVNTEMLVDIILNINSTSFDSAKKGEVKYKNFYKNSLTKHKANHVDVNSSSEAIFSLEKVYESEYSNAQIQQKIENICINLLFDQHDISLIFDLIKDFNSEQWENLFKMQQQKNTSPKVFKLQSK